MDLKGAGQRAVEKAGVQVWVRFMCECLLYSFPLGFYLISHDFVIDFVLSIAVVVALCIFFRTPTAFVYI